MSNPENHRDLPEFHIFSKFFERIFGFSPEIDKWEFDPEKIKIKDTIPLLLWPIILSFKLLCPANETEIIKKLNELVETNSETEFEALFEKISEFLDLLNDEWFSEKYSDFLESLEVDEDYQKLFDIDLSSNTKLGFNFSDLLKEDSYVKFIDDLISDKINWKRNNALMLPKFVRKIIFLFLILSLLDGQMIRKLSLSICYYFFIYFLFIESLEIKNESPYITQFGIISNFAILDKHFGHTEHVISFIATWIGSAGTLLFGQGMQFLINDYENIFPNTKESKIEEFEVHYFSKDNPNYFAFIEPNNENKAGYSIGFFKKIQFLKDRGYYLEAFFLREDPDRLLFSPILTFKSKEDNKTDSEHLLFCLYLLWEKISIFAIDAMDSINEFIDDPSISVKKDLKSFKERMKLIINSYSLFDEYISQKNLSRAVETLDMEYENSDIDQIRSKIKKAKRHHLSPNLRSTLLEANKELGILFYNANLIRRQKRSNKKQDDSIHKQDDFIYRGSNEIKSVKKYLEDNPHQFKIIQLDDIKNIRFTSYDNGIRNARREVLAKIAERHNKYIPGSRITKELGLE